MNEVGPRDTTPEGTDTTTPAAKTRVSVDLNGAGGYGGADAETLRVYLHTTLGDATGYLITATGTGGHLDANGKYRHTSWRERPYTWPAQAEKAVAAMLAAAPHSDVYVCPYVMKTPKRAKGTAVTHTLVHADIDRTEPGEEHRGHPDLKHLRDGAKRIDVLLDQLQVRYEFDGFAVSSGTPGHAHVYVPLTRSVTAAQHEALCRALTKHLGGDPGKISDNDFLRPAGTLNHKPTVHGNEPTPVLSVEGIFPDSRRVDPSTLADRLGVNLAYAETNGKPHTAGVSIPCEPVDLTAYPAVQADLDNVTGDRSKDTWRVLAACRKAGFIFEQAQQVVLSRPDLAERLAGRNDDDLMRSWIRLIDEQQRLEIGGEKNTVTSSSTPGSKDKAAIDGMPRLWRATDLKPAVQPSWLAQNRIPRAAVTLLVGDEGIGKSLLWVWVAAAVTTGKALPEFGIPAREPSLVIVVVTEDDWQDTVLPRLEVAGADMAMIRVICTETTAAGRRSSRAICS